jgi:hypothetical protein
MLDWIVYSVLLIDQDILVSSSKITYVTYSSSRLPFTLPISGWGQEPGWRSAAYVAKQHMDETKRNPTILHFTKEVCHFAESSQPRPQ